MLIIVYTKAKITAMMISGVSAPMTWLTFSTSSIPAASTTPVISSAPAQAGRPNCCSRLEPAPASITKPTANRVIVTETSKNRETMGCATLRNTMRCSSARK